jgi:FeS assembly protein IscX
MHWEDIEEIAECLEENYPDEDISEIKLPYLEEMVRSLVEFDDHSVDANKEILKEILEAWALLRE